MSPSPTLIISKLFFVIIFLLSIFNRIVSSSTKKDGLKVIETVTPNGMHSFITSQHTFILMYSEADEEYQSALFEIQKLLKADLLFLEDCRYGKMQTSTFGEKYGVKKLPALVFFRQKSPIVYDGDSIEAGDIAEWMEASQNEAMRVLNDNNFEHLTQASTGSTTGDWLTLFYKPGCGLVAMTTMEGLAVRMHHTLNIAKIQMNTSPKLVERFKVKKCPTLIFFRHGKMYQYEPEEYSVKSMRGFVESWHRNVKAEIVPVEPSAFDLLTDFIVKKLKEHETKINLHIVLPVFFLSFITLVLLCLFCCRQPIALDKHKSH